MNDREEELFVSGVARALDSKSKLFGFELPDLLLIFANLTITNLIFGQTAFKIPLVWGTTILIAGVLFFAKRGRPDSYLQHLGEFLLRPSHFSGGSPDLRYDPFLIKEK
jgi:hypothetical protein